MRDVFGDRRIPVSSMKSMIGHCMGAASAIEAVGCLLRLKRDLPAHGGLRDPRSRVRHRCRRKSARGPGPSDVVVNNSLAFGGYNAVAFFAKPGFFPPPDARFASSALSQGAAAPEQGREGLAITGFGACLRWASGAAFFDAMAAGNSLAPRSQSGGEP